MTVCDGTLLIFFNSVLLSARTVSHIRSPGRDGQEPDMACMKSMYERKRGMKSGKNLTGVGKPYCGGLGLGVSMCFVALTAFEWQLRVKAV